MVNLTSNQIKAWKVRSLQHNPRFSLSKRRTCYMSGVAAKKHCIDHVNITCWGDLGSLTAFSFSPLLGEVIQFDEHTIQMRWNHQLDQSGEGSDDGYPEANSSPLKIDSWKMNFLFRSLILRGIIFREGISKGMGPRNAMDPFHHSTRLIGPERGGSSQDLPWLITPLSRVVGPLPDGLF